MSKLRKQLYIFRISALVISYLFPSSQLIPNRQINKQIYKNKTSITANLTSWLQVDRYAEREREREKEKKRKKETYGHRLHLEVVAPAMITCMTRIFVYGFDGNNVTKCIIFYTRGMNLFKSYGLLSIPKNLINMCVCALYVFCLLDFSVVPQHQQSFIHSVYCYRKLMHFVPIKTTDSHVDIFCVNIARRHLLSLVVVMTIDWAPKETFQLKHVFNLLVANIFNRSVHKPLKMCGESLTSIKCIHISVRT